MIEITRHCTHCNANVQGLQFGRIVKLDCGHTIHGNVLLMPNTLRGLQLLQRMDNK